MNKKNLVSVIGGGFIGLACALRLAQRGVDVTVFEKEICGSGASGASLGVLWSPSPKQDGVYAKFHRESLLMFEEFVAELSELADQEIDFRKSGGLELLATERGFINASEKATYTPYCLNGEKYPGASLISSETVLQMEPELPPIPYGALHTPSVCSVDAEQVVSALVKACFKVGVAIRERTEVHTLLPAKNGAYELRLKDETFNASTVLIAGGSWSSDLIPFATGIPHIVPVRGDACLIKVPGCALSHIIKYKEIYVIPRGDGVFALGATTYPDADRESVRMDNEASPLLAIAGELFPKHKVIMPIRSWSGLRPKASGGKPFLGTVPNHAGLYIAAGHYKVGLSLTPITAEVMSSLILDGESKIPYVFRKPAD